MKPGNLSPLSSHPETNLMRWLEQRGFRYNPFEYTNAEYEQETLPGYFVDMGEFDTLLAIRQPCVIYAGRGCGKTAQRQMMAAQCRPDSPTSAILAIHYTYEGFERAFTAAESSIEKVNVSHHVDALLYAGMAALANEMEVDKSVRDALCKADLLPQTSAYLDRYAPDWYFQQVKGVKKAALRAYTPLELLRKFSNLLFKAGFQSGMVFVDGLDEFVKTASDPEQSALFLANLLGTLPLIECPGLSFKFFLSQELEQALLRHDWYRPDRLYISRILWDQARLEAMIRQRLIFFSKRIPAYESLAQVCDDQLGPVINGELGSLSGSMPRPALRLANMLIREHAGLPIPPERISFETWGKVKVKWPQAGSSVHPEPPEPPETIPAEIAIPPSPASAPETALLRIEEDKGLVWLGENEIRGEMTPKDYQVLVCLYKYVDRVCSKETIALEGWEENDSSGVSDAAIAASIRRIRAALKKHADKIEYIITVRGKGRGIGGYRLFPQGKLPDDQSPQPC